MSVVTHSTLATPPQDVADSNTSLRYVRVRWARYTDCAVVAEGFVRCQSLGVCVSVDVPPDGADGVEDASRYT